MRGNCLCGSVAFELDVATLRLYRCHCSLCRRQTGTASNCAAIVDASHFRWVTGIDQITSWAKPTGYRSDFCRTCGSAVPRLLKARNAVWIPAGLMEAAMSAEIVADFSVASRSSWDSAPLAQNRHDAFPDVESFYALMHPQ